MARKVNKSCALALGTCNGGDSCCGANGYKCGEGEGDCDSDNDCQPGLICHQQLNNCKGDGFDSTDDCCTKPTTGTVKCEQIFIPYAILSPTCQEKVEGKKNPLTSETAFVSTTLLKN